jgi:hypothetical protein
MATVLIGFLLVIGPALLFRRLSFVVVIVATMLGIGRSSVFLVRASRVVGEVVTAGVLAYANHQLYFYEGRFAPKEAVRHTFHIEIPALGGLTSVVVISFITLGLLVLIAVTGWMGRQRYEESRILRIAARSTNAPHGDIKIRFTLFNAAVISLARRRPAAWVRTELGCLLLAAAGVLASENVAGMEQDKWFRRLLGPTAEDWHSLLSLVSLEATSKTDDPAPDIQDFGYEIAQHVRQHVVHDAPHPPL